MDDRLLLRLEALVHAFADANEARVHTVKPDRRLIAAVVVVVPAPVRRRHDVAGLHRERLTVDDELGTLRRLKHEPGLADKSAVGLRALTGHKALHREVQRIAHTI